MSGPDRPLSPLVVLIEDQDDLRYVLAAVLEHGGMRVAGFATAGEGLEAARRLAPDLLITDFIIPGADGLEVARRLTHADGTRPMPTMLVSAHLQDAPAAEVASLFDAVLAKPVDPAELVATARSLLCRPHD